MRRKSALSLLLSVSLLVAVPATAGAHCDAMDGPVVKDAQAALRSGHVTGVLKWVRAEDEQEIRALFDEVMTVRAHGGAAQKLAERYFFESLVRIHRAGEGAPYTGLKPAGRIEPIIAVSDQALERGSVDTLVHKVVAHVEQGIRQKFQEALEAGRHAEDNVAAGRAYVAAYVEYVHYVEGLHDALAGAVHAHQDTQTSGHVELTVSP
ncbi:MAG: hypothetical protein JW993_21290 [Sedimentisphaerales bacterium]|nr:hypothetical protein [Sedimentisphaerales bacterium]